MKFNDITRWGTMISFWLWASALFLMYSKSSASAMIVAILAAFSQVIATKSAQREGALKERKNWFIDRILDEVGDED